MAEMRGEVHRHLYGRPDGVYLILESRGGVLPPPQVSVSDHDHTGLIDLVYLGRTYDVVTMLDEALRDQFAAADIQGYIASLLGVSQQSVSRYVNQGAEPRLKPAGWAQLVRAYFRFKPAEARRAR